MIIDRDGYRLTDELERLDPAALADLLREAFWAVDRTDEQILEACRHSVCLGLLHEGRLVGFVRALTDWSVNSYLCDFVITADYQRRGLGSWLLEVLLTLPPLARTQKLLLTRDAEAFYERHGFTEHPFRCLVKRP